MISSQPAISLQGVAKSYGRQPALHQLDLDIAEGEFFCLLGPSGCGKTTTLNIIGGFVAPSAGAVFIRGKQVDELPPHRRDVNTVFQSYALFPHMTVGANVGFGLRMAGVARDEARRRVRAAIEMVGLEELETRLPLELSGGQQQRVAVARALVNRPAVLLLDEPLGALDLKLRKRLQVELAQIHREVGTVFVYVTHDQEEALALSDRIAVMREGLIEQIGTPEEIYRRPRSRFVAEFIGESNFLPRAGGSAGRPVHRDGPAGVARDLAGRRTSSPARSCTPPSSAASRAWRSAARAAPSPSSPSSTAGTAPRRRTWRQGGRSGSRGSRAPPW